MKQAMWWHDNNNKLGFTIGALTGLYKLLMNVRLPIEFPSKLIESAITAGVCGLMGLAGKEVWIVGKRAFIAYFKKRKTKK
jgi:hypothetical protein